MEEQGEFELDWIRTEQGANCVKLRPEIILGLYLGTYIV